MATKTRCFATVKALKRLNPELLCATLRKFPEYLKERGLKLPRVINEENVPYEEIRLACMSGDIPLALDDVLFFVCLLGTNPGWEKIEAEAQRQGLSLDFPVDGLTTADLAMKAWLHDWPRNQHLLEQTYARSRIQGKSAYVYYGPVRDVRANYRPPTPEGLSALRDSLEAHFHSQGLGCGTNVVHYDFEKEIWFLVRYPGHPRRYPAINDEGEAVSHVFKPEEYDAIVYHKEFGDLRLNTNRKRDHGRYRIEFADLLLKENNLFHPKYKMVSLAPLLGDCAALFRCKDIPGLKDIVPIEIRYTSMANPGQILTIKAADGSHLLYYDPAKANIMQDDQADSVQLARFRYLCSDRSRHGTLTLHAGQVLTYERDGDSAVLEHWLRLRNFLRCPLDKINDEIHATALS